MSPSRRLIALLGVAAIAGLPVAGCGGDDGGSGGGNGGSTQQQEKQPAAVVASGDPTAGKQVFAQNCAACHGEDGGGGSGPNLHQESYTDPEIVVNQVRNGGGGMPAFGDRLSEQELADVTAYVAKDLAKR